MTQRSFLAAALALALFAPLPRALFAQAPATQPGDEDRPDRADRPGRPGHETRTTHAGPTSQPGDENIADKISVTEHDIVIGGKPLHYRATAAQLPSKDDQGKIRAHIFYISYEKLDDHNQPDRSRPVTFVFNGGPGAAAVWLHLGTAGPLRVDLPDDGMTPAPLHPVVDNPETWLTFTDLVLIDPVGTGYSRTVQDDSAGPGHPGHDQAPPTNPAEFYSAHGDVESVADFIRLWTTTAQRWTSPKFVAGESYGTTRAAALSDYLIERYGIDLQGIVLISTVLNFQDLDYSPGNDVPYPLYVPTYTALAWYHKKLAPDLQGDLKKATDESRQWALGDYTTALARGASLDDGQRQTALEKLARFTGLPQSYVNHSNLRISPAHFRKALLADDEKILGRYDGRVTGHDTEPLRDSPNIDPSQYFMMTSFTKAFNDYIRRELKYENDLNYETLSPLVGNWEFGGAAGQGYYNVAPALAAAITKNPALKVLVCCGYYDLATPFVGAEYQFNSMPLSKELRQNVSFAYYESGHMVYLPKSGLEKLNADMETFYNAALPAAQP